MIRNPISVVAGVIVFTVKASMLPLMAAEALGERPNLNLLKTLELAVNKDPTFQAAQANYLAAREAKPQARSFLLPQINAGASYERAGQTTKRSTFVSGSLSSDIETTQYGLNLNQVIFNRDLFLGLDQADASVAQAEAGLEAARQDLILRVAQAYFDVLGAEDTLRFTTAEKKAVGRQLEQAQKRFEVGLIAITDVKEAQANYDTAIADEIVAKNNIDIARNALAIIIGQFFGNLSKLSDRMLLITPEPEDPDQWMQRALEQNLQVVATRFAMETTGLEVKRQRAGHYPTVDMTASANQSNSTGGIFGADTGELNIGIEINMPIYTGGLVNSRTREAHFNHLEAQELLTQQRRDAAKLARDSYLNVIAGISRVKALSRAVESNQASADATRAGFEVGTRTSVDVLIALRALFNAERNYALSRYEYLLETLSLQQAAGILSVDDLENINKWLD
jgi:outer membrane protein